MHGRALNNLRQVVSLALDSSPRVLGVETRSINGWLRPCEGGAGKGIELVG